MTKLDIQRIQAALQDLPHWRLSTDQKWLLLEHSFDDFKQAFAAMSKIAIKAEDLNHHPNWSNVYNKLKIELQTHDAGTVTQKDLELAQYIESVLSHT